MTLECLFRIFVLYVYVYGISLWMESSARRHKPLHRQPKESPNSFSRAIVVAETRQCAQMGKDVLKDGGSAVDAAIGTVLCLAVSEFASTGIGGGGHMVIYTRSTRKVEVIDFKECAPSRLSDSDFKHPWKEGEYFVDPNLIRGGMAVGVPGMLKGFELAHKRHGKYPWSKLFEAAARLAENTTHMGTYFLSRLDEDLAKYNNTEFKDFREFRSSRDKTSFTNPALAKTLRIIGEAGSAAPFYDGVLSQTVVEDIQKHHGAITLKDLRNYRAILREPVEVTLGDKMLYSTPPPAGGTVLSLILNILDGYHFSKKDTNHGLDGLVKVYHKMIEAFKWSYASTELLGDPAFKSKIHHDNDTFITSTNESTSEAEAEMEMHFLDQNIKELLSKENSAVIRKAISESQTYNVSYYNPDGLIGQLEGTTHVSIVAENGDAVAITSSLNELFGSYVFSKKLGILFNNQMRDFREFGSISPKGNSDSPTNVILPGKRIPSFMSPTVIVDGHGDVFMVIGAAGGSRIPSVVAQVIARFLWLGQSPQSSVSEPRFHHQLYPNILFVERVMPKQVRDKLEALGHRVSENIGLIAHYPLSNLARLQAVVVERRNNSNEKSIMGVNDIKRRGGGSSAGY